ncbi:MAG: BNR-repeat neuraminidase N-terminal domain-containing protein, partial [Bacteroidales bacterium]
MRYGFLVLVFLVSLQAAGQDTVFVQQVNSPLLIDRTDNVLVRLRVKVDEPSVFRGVRLALSLEGVGDVRGSTTDVVKAVRLFYAGTEAPQRASGFFMAPVGYLSSGTPGLTLAANPSYSLVQSEVKGPKGEVTLASGQPLFAGIHYFWVSVQLQPKAPLTAKLSASVVSVSLEKRVSLNGGDALEVAGAVLQQVGQKPPFYRLGVGVRHAGNDGSAAFRIPGLVTSNRGTLLGVYDVRYNNSADLQEHVDIGLSRSTNGGQSWEKMRIIMDMGTFGGLPEGQNGVGDPSILVDTQTGYIWVVAAWTHAMGNGRAWVNSRSGMS